MDITEGNFTVRQRPEVELLDRPLDEIETPVLQREVMALINRNQELREQNMRLRKFIGEEILKESIPFGENTEEALRARD
jgi:hypothetical protein